MRREILVNMIIYKCHDINVIMITLVGKSWITCARNRLYLTLRQEKD